MAVAEAVAVVVVVVAPPFDVVAPVLSVLGVAAVPPSSEVMSTGGLLPLLLCFPPPLLHQHDSTTSAASTYAVKPLSPDSPALHGRQAPGSGSGHERAVQAGPDRCMPRAGPTTPVAPSPAPAAGLRATHACSRPDRPHATRAHHKQLKTSAFVNDAIALQQLPAAIGKGTPASIRNLHGTGPVVASTQPRHGSRGMWLHGANTPPSFKNKQPNQNPVKPASHLWRSFQE